MNTCKNCAFWGAYRENVCDGERGSVKSTFSRAHRALANTSPNGFAVHADASDDTGLDSALVTGPDFGCIHFENKS